MTSLPNTSSNTGSELTVSAVFRPSNGNWYIKGPGNLGWGGTKVGNLSIQCGQNGDIPVLADFDGTGRCRLGVFRPSNGTWYIKGHGNKNWGETKDNNLVIQCGQNGDIPVAYDFFNEGRARIAVFRPSNGTWYIKGLGFENWGKSKDNLSIQCGQNGDVPVVADFFNEGNNRIGVFRPKDGNWHIKGNDKENWGKSSGNVSIQCGQNGDIPLVRNFFGNGNRLGVFRPGNGTWYIKGFGQNNWGKSSDNLSIQCGQNGDIPVSGDFFGDGFSRIAVFRPGNGTWYIKGSGTGNWGQSKDNNLSIQCGQKGDIPVLGNINFSRINKFNLAGLLLSV